MGTETHFLHVNHYGLCSTLVKKNNPLMGTETGNRFRWQRC